MKLRGEHHIPASRQAVWKALNDADMLRACLPGCETLEKISDTEMTAKITTKIGPVRATFTGAVTLSDLDPPIGYKLSGEGQGGAAGFAKGRQSRLDEVADTTVIARPKVMCLNRQKAEILVGQNVPFQTGSYTTDASGAGNPFTTIERKDIGVTLKVTPHINEGATLRLEIEQEISSIAPSTGLNAQAVDLVTNKRSIKNSN